jgi:hypothetical protein
VTDVTLDEQLCSKLSQKTQLLDPSGKVHGMFLPIRDYEAILATISDRDLEDNESARPTVSQAQTLEGYISTNQLLAELRQMKLRGKASA